MTFRFRFFIDVNDLIYMRSARFLHSLHDLFKSFFFFFVQSFRSFVYVCFFFFSFFFVGCIGISLGHRQSLSEFAFIEVGRRRRRRHRHRGYSVVVGPITILYNLIRI